MAEIVFLGTGASGGTPGEGRSRRRESSTLLRHRDHHLLIDVTRDFDEQSAQLERVDAVLNTHAHRDASGGLRALARWLGDRDHDRPVPVHAHAEAIATFRSRWARLPGLELREASPRTTFDLGPWSATPVPVPHARDTPTYAWRLDGPSSLVYASDVAELTGGLREASDGAGVLVIDGAMWGRSLYSHLRLDEVIDELCSWEVARILVTQIGRTAPPHDSFVEAVRDRCGRAEPAYDGLVVGL